MLVRSLAFRTDIELLRLGGSEVVDHGDHLIVRSPHNPTFWWGNFLLLRDLPAAEDVPAWIARFAVEFPGTDHLAIGIDRPDLDVDDLAPFAGLGCSVSADVVLTAREIAGRTEVAAVCRILDGDDDWAQSLELNLVGLSPDDRSRRLPFVRGRVDAARRLARSGHGAWFGAFVDGRLVAELGVVRTADGLARYQSVLTAPAARRRGFARALLVTAGRFALDDLGARTLVIVVDPTNPALELYRSVGFVPLERQVQVEGTAAPSS